MKTIYLASGNAHKLHELLTALDQAGLLVKVSGPDALGGMPEVEETELTFEGVLSQGWVEGSGSERWLVSCR